MLKTFISSVFRNVYLTENASRLQTRCITTSVTNWKERVDNRKEMLKSMPAADEGTSGEKAIDIDSMITQKEDVFPTIGFMNKMFNGVPFKEIPVINIKVSPNNTIINYTDIKGVPKMHRSCGMEGFKNTRKGTNIAAQATAITIGGKILERGVKQVRVRVRGLGPGRMSSIKGLQMAGLNIVSITDYTRVSWNPPRPRKARKL